MATCKWGLSKKKDGTHVISMKEKYYKKDCTRWYNFGDECTSNEELQVIVKKLNELATKDPLGFSIEVGQGGAWHISWKNNCVAWNGCDFSEGPVFEYYNIATDGGN